MAFLLQELIRLAKNDPKERFIPVESLRANKGDMIEINHKKFCHWALYIGDGIAIHLTNSRQPITDSNEINDLIESNWSKISTKSVI